MSDWKQQLREAKEMLEEGLIDRVEFDAMKQQIRASIGLSTTPAAGVSPLSGQKTHVSPAPSPAGSTPLGGQTHMAATPAEVARVDGQNQLLQPTPNPSASSGLSGQTTVEPEFGGSAPHFELVPGMEIGQYRIKAKIGSGGMGAVYRARHKLEQFAQQTGDVAIKVMHPHLAADQSFVNRFISEAGTGRQLSHPNVIRIHDVVVQGTTLALVMDLVEGQSLSTLIPAGGFSYEKVVEIVKPLCEALDAMHQQGIVHRDLKPENIVIRNDGRPVILDMGIAKNTSSNMGGTRTGMSMGTPLYMAPEQGDAKHVSGAADRYALGLIVYQMLTGTLPWPEDSGEYAIISYKMTGRYIPLGERNVKLRGLWSCIERLLKVEPRERFTSCVAFLTDLFRAQAKEAEEQGEKNNSTQQSIFPKSRSQKRTNPPEAGDEGTSLTQRHAQERMAVFAHSSLTAGSVHSFGVGVGSHEMVYIPAGEFMMGALPNDEGAYRIEKPRHPVTISQPFLLGKYVVTQDLYESVMGENPSRFKGSTHPVERVSWCDAVLFCNELSEREGLQPVYNLPKPFANDQAWSKRVMMNRKANGYRLPTEAEWEYAARGVQDHLYAGSNEIDEVAWYWDNSEKRTHPVGQKNPNASGVYDLSGNVWEWVWDWKSNYSSSSQIDPTGPVSGAFRCLRGGSWNGSCNYVRVLYRSDDQPSYRSGICGFRVLRTFP